jgi:uncharacterized protein
LRLFRSNAEVTEEHKPRLVLDTNVLIAAVVSRGGSAAKIVRLWREGRLDLLYTQETLAEARTVVGQTWVERVGGRDGPGQLLAELEEKGVRIEGTPRLNLTLRHPGDRRLIEAAVAGNADFVVTSDREVLAMGEFMGVRMTKARDALQALGIEQPG